MEANFYFIAESFQYNQHYSNEVIVEKVKRLAEDVKVINKYSKFNKFFGNYTTLYPII